MNINALTQLLVYFGLAACVFWMLWWVANQFPSPFSTVARVIIAIFAAVFLLNLLLPMMGQPPIVRIIN